MTNNQYLILNNFYLVENRVCKYIGTTHSKYFGTMYLFVDEFNYCRHILTGCLPYIKKWIGESWQ